MATTTPISVFGLLELLPLSLQNGPVSEQLFLIFGHARIRCASDPSKDRQARPSARDQALHHNNSRRTGINEGTN